MSANLRNSLASEVTKALPYPDWAEVNDVALEVADERAGQLVVGLAAEKKRRVALVVARGLQRGWADEVIADRLETLVGLDPRSAQAVENYREGLAGAGHPKGVIARMARDYANRLREHRALVVARTEVHGALLEAQRRIWRAQQERGDISGYAVRVTVVHKDERLCPVCRPQGGQRHTLRNSVGGPPFHPQCRCYEVLVDEGIVGMEKIAKVITPGGRRGSDAPLGRSPKRNWVDRVGGLPKYIRMVAHGLLKDGKTMETAISMAVAAIKRWARGGDNVSPKVQAAAIKALAEWEAKKAKAHVAKSEETRWTLEDWQEARAQLRRDGII